MERRHVSVLEWALFELRLRGRESDGRLQQLLLLTGVLVRLHRLGQVAEVAEDAQMEQLVGLDSTYEKKYITMAKHNSSYLVVDSCSAKSLRHEYSETM